MVNLGRDSGFTANPNQFIKRLEKLITFAAHVGDVPALVFGGHFAHLDQFVGFGIKRRRINQRGADAKGARFHFLAHEFAHLIQLLRCRRFVFETDYVFANRGGADKRSDVAGDAVRLQIT